MQILDLTLKRDREMQHVLPQFILKSVDAVGRKSPISDFRTPNS
jgi:hypothetical protein